MVFITINNNQPCLGICLHIATLPVALDLFIIYLYTSILIGFLNDEIDGCRINRPTKLLDKKDPTLAALVLEFRITIYVIK